MHVPLLRGKIVKTITPRTFKTCPPSPPQNSTFGRIFVQRHRRITTGTTYTGKGAGIKPYSGVRRVEVRLYFYFSSKLLATRLDRTPHSYHYEKYTLSKCTASYHVHTTKERRSSRGLYLSSHERRYRKGDITSYIAYFIT